MNELSRGQRRTRTAAIVSAFRRVLGDVMPIVTLFIIVVEWNGIPGQARDTVAYHAAATAPTDAVDAVYSPLPEPGPHEFTGLWPYLYPPVLAAFLSFFPDTTYREFDRGWLVANVLAFWLLAIALARISQGEWTLRASLTWAAALFFLPGAWLSIHYGNIDLMILTLLAWGMLFSRAGGGILALAAAFKVTPLWPLIVLLVRRPRSTTVGAMVGVLAGIGACLLAYGFSGTVNLFQVWFTRVLPSLSQGQFWGGSIEALRSGDLSAQDYLANLSLSFLPFQLAAIFGWDYVGGPLPMFARVYLTGFAAVVPVLAGWAVRRRSVNVQVAAVAVASLWAAPIVRPYVLSAALLVMAALHQERRDLARSPRSPAPRTDP